MTKRGHLRLGGNFCITAKLGRDLLEFLLYRDKVQQNKLVLYLVIITSIWRLIYINSAQAVALQVEAKRLVSELEEA